mgnify:CR=1 FL=1
MKILLVADLHYTLKQWDWLSQASGDFDLVVIAGDMLDIVSIVDVEVQILVLGAIFLVVGFVFSLCLGAAAGVFARILRSRVRVLSRISAVMFGGLAARLVWE